MSEQRGRFLWYECMTEDVEAAKAFYSEIAGWRTQKWEDGEYTMWMVGDRPIGGVMKLPEEAKKMGAPPHWLAHVGSPDVDAGAKLVSEQGGKVLVPPSDIPKVGRFSVVQDPQGAVLSLYAPSGPMPGGPEEPELGDFSWHELATTDHNAAWSFYEPLFGWSKMDAMDMGPMGTYQIYGHGGKALGGMFNKPAEMPGPPSWLYYIKVADVKATLGRVEKMGGKVLAGPQEVPGGDLIGQCVDPQGVAFAIHSAAPKA